MIKIWQLCTAQSDFGEFLAQGSNDLLTINFFKMYLSGLDQAWECARLCVVATAGERCVMDKKEGGAALPLSPFCGILEGDIQPFRNGWLWYFEP